MKGDVRLNISSHDKVTRKCDFLLEFAMSDSGSISSSIVTLEKSIRDDTIGRLTENQIKNLEAATNEIKETRADIEQLVLSNRGGDNGIHGFISERLQTCIGNAKSLVRGEGIHIILIDDNGRDDLLIDSRPVQMKFVQKALSLDAVKEHIHKYPDSIPDGELYMIPKDYWEKLQYLWSLSSEEAGALRITDYNLWLKLQSLAAEEGLNKDSLCAAEFNYADAQKNAYQKTLDGCQKDVEMENQEAINKIHYEHRPTWDEAIKTMAFGAALEGILRGGGVVIEKYQDGVKICDYTKEDVLDVVEGAGKGAIVGTIRSGVVYAATNYTPIPGGVASGVVTFAERAITLTIKEKKGEIDHDEYKNKMTEAAFDATLTTSFALIGSKVCRKHPVIGALAGTASAKIVLFVSKKVDLPFMDALEEKFYA